MAVSVYVGGSGTLRRPLYQSRRRLCGKFKKQKTLIHKGKVDFYTVALKSYGPL